MVTKAEAQKGATNVANGDTNPNGIETFIDFKASKVTVYTTALIAKHYPKVGTAVSLEKNKSEKWIDQGYATADAPAPAEKTAKKGKEA